MSLCGYPQFKEPGETVYWRSLQSTALTQRACERPLYSRVASASQTYSSSAPIQLGTSISDNSQQGRAPMSRASTDSQSFISESYNISRRKSGSLGFDPLSRSHMEDTALTNPNNSDYAQNTGLGCYSRPSRYSLSTREGEPSWDRDAVPFRLRNQ